jgi:hypothetical protein
MPLISCSYALVKKIKIKIKNQVNRRNITGAYRDIP